jgi:hypothetical protein
VTVQPRQEFKFLTELRYLSDLALYYADRIRHQARNWEEADAVHQAALHNAADQKKRFQAMMDLNTSGAAKIEAQTELFSLVEAFLGLWGRISLILFPQREKGNPVRRDRAEHLRSILQTSSDSRFGNRVVRNTWLHFDEVLDQLGDRYQNAQKFVQSRDFREGEDINSLRVLVVDKLQLHYAGVGTFELADLFEAVQDLESRVQEAINSWPERHKEGLDE